MTNTLTLNVSGAKINKTVAETILAQLGGSRFVAMTGAHNISASDSMIQMNIKARNKAGCNALVINYYKGSDDYTMIFYKVKPIRLNKKTMEVEGGFTEIKKVKGVYCEMLQDVFTNTTGLYTRL